jgi:hypothetical protein
MPNACASLIALITSSVSIADAVTYAEPSDKPGCGSTAALAMT